ncbi:MAG: hypothetical protein AAFO84_17130, partial [Cyanobacteria bacterium J06598_1]
NAVVIFKVVGIWRRCYLADVVSLKGIGGRSHPFGIPTTLKITTAFFLELDTRENIYAISVVCVTLLMPTSHTSITANNTAINTAINRVM